jgi:hypothetical protein
LDQARALQNSQSPVDTEGGGDGTTIELPLSRRWSILLIIEKLMYWSKPNQARRPPTQAALLSEQCCLEELGKREVAMPRCFFDVEDGHRLFDASGFVCEDDTDAIIRATVLAIGVSLDKPEDDPERRIAIINDAGREIGTVPVYSKPSYGNPAK